MICHNCGKPIHRDFGDKWTHTNLDEQDRLYRLTGVPGFQLTFGNRGCRAASFTDKDGWDESLDRKWKARPKR